MFNAFSIQLYRRLALREYRAAAETQSPADAPLWAARKIENATLCELQIIDCARCDPEALHAAQPVRLAAAARHGEDFRGVMLIHLLVSETPEAKAAHETAFAVLTGEAEAYMGQAVYAVFWHVVLSTGEITAPAGQPRELFGLRALAQAAMADTREVDAVRDPAQISPEDAAPTFTDIAREAASASPYNPRCRSAVCTWALLTVNVVVLLLMYLDGYGRDIMTAVRFGAIVPERVADGEYFRLFAAMFVHFGWMHLGMNALGLIIFGRRAERYFGRGPFLATYGLSGLCASVCSLLFTQGYAAGASGAVYGLVGALFVFMRVSKCSVEYINDYLMLVYIAVGLAMGWLMPGVDHFGHMGGLLMGAALGAVFTAARKRAKLAF